jgi:thiamine kinase-like enzyme
MKAAAEAGLAPHVWYTSIEDRISITDFVETASFPIREALVRIPAALRTLHALPPFPAVPHPMNTSCLFLINKGAAADAFIQRFQAANLLPKVESEELFARYSQMCAAYPHRDSDMVSSHNDLFKPDNILFDGNQLWLVDWEAAFLNDRYADLAVAANLVVN